MSDASCLRIAAMVEGYSVMGAPKAVLEFAREVSLPNPDLPRVDLSILTFIRGTQEENSFTRAARNLGLSLNVVRERRRFDTKVISQLRSWVSAQHPDILWSNNVKSHFLTRLAGLNRAAKWVAFHHGYTATDAKMLVYNQLDRWSLRAADRVLTVCQPFARQLERAGVPPDRIRIQHMPVRPFPPLPAETISRLRVSLGLTERTRVVLSVGRLSREKSHADLVRAFARVAHMDTSESLRLVLVGEGPERRVIEAACRRLGVADVVTLAGHQDDVQPYYGMADVFVLPSHSEGSPNVLLEAMAAGLPVVATSVGGVPELAVNGREALLVEKGDISGLAASIRRILTDTQLSRHLACSARGVLSRNAPQAYVRAILSVFQEVLSMRAWSEDDD